MLIVDFVGVVRGLLGLKPEHWRENILGAKI